MRLHRWNVFCPQCNKEATINEIRFSAMGEIYLNLLCVLCGISLDYNSSWEKIVIACHERDNLKPLILTEVSAEIQ